MLCLRTLFTTYKVIYVCDFYICSILFGLTSDVVFSFSAKNIVLAGVKVGTLSAYLILFNKTAQELIFSDSLTK